MGVWMFGGNLSPDGNSFTYTNSATDIEVWNLAGPLQPEYGDSPTVGHAADVQLSDLALNSNGSRLATASDGAIYVSDVRPREQSNGYITLHGAGSSPHSLKFLSDTMIVSASGSSAALWDLDRTIPLATVMPADVGKSCSACWPPVVAASPNGKKVVITNDQNGSSFINTETGRTVTYFSYSDAQSDADKALQAATTTTWLGDDRLFVYSANGRGWVLRGDQLDEVERTFDLPPGSRRSGDVTQLSQRFDGSVLVMSGDVMFRVDPNNGHYAVADPPANALTPGGGYAIHVTEGGAGKTDLKVIDTDNFRVIKDVSVDGKLLNFAAINTGGLALLRAIGKDDAQTDTELLSLDVGTGAVRTVGRLGRRIIAAAVTATADTLFAEANGTVMMYSLHDASQLPLIPVKSAVRAWNGLGVTADASTLLIASETEKAVLRVPAAADAWLSLACQTAGRDVHEADLQNVVASLQGIVPGCGNALPR